MISRKQSLLKLEQALQIAKANNNIKLANTLQELLLEQKVRAPQQGGTAFNNELISITRPIEPHVKASIKKKAYKYDDRIELESKEEIAARWSKFQQTRKVFARI